MHVTAILPVYNEAKTVRSVLDVLLSSKLIDQVVTVDDASTDNTLEILQSFKDQKLKVIHLDENLGKSDAVKIATDNLKTDILFFCDGDLRNFREEHIEEILKPFEKNKILMSAGLIDYNIIIKIISLTVFPLVTGERAINYSVFEEVKQDPLFKNYAMEALLNDYCKRNKIPIHKKIMKDLRQLNKPFKVENGYYLLFLESLELITVLFKLRGRRIKSLFS